MIDKLEEIGSQTLCYKLNKEDHIFILNNEFQHSYLKYKCLVGISSFLKENSIDFRVDEELSIHILSSHP